MTDGNRCVLIAPPARNSRQPGSRAPMSRASTAQPHAPKCSVQDCFVCVSCSHAKNSAKPNYKSIRKVWVKLIGRKSSGGARNPCLAMKRDSAAPHCLRFFCGTELLLLSQSKPVFFKLQKFVGFLDGSHHHNVWFCLLRKHLTHPGESKHEVLRRNDHVHGCRIVNTRPLRQVLNC